MTGCLIVQFLGFVRGDMLMSDRTAWEYFILRRHINAEGAITYVKGDTKEAVCPPNVDESQVLGIFGQHGYELCSVQSTRTGDTKYYLKRPSKG